MPQCVVIADDLTGGNATGVQLRQSNFTSMSILTEDALETAAHADSDCVIYPTNSRAVPPEEAYRRVYNATRKLMSPDVKVYSKRVDSTRAPAAPWSAVISSSTACSCTRRTSP